MGFDFGPPKQQSAVVQIQGAAGTVSGVKAAVGQVAAWPEVPTFEGRYITLASKCGSYLFGPGSRK